MNIKSASMILNEYFLKSEAIFIGILTR